MVTAFVHSRFRSAIQMSLPMAVFVVGGCGQPPCFEGKLQVEAGEIVQGSNCIVHTWPGDEAFDVSDAGRLRPGISCEDRHAEYVEQAWGHSDSSGVLGAGGVFPGDRFALLETIRFEVAGCTEKVEAELRMPSDLSDVDAGIRAQEAGGDIFYLKATFNADDNCSGRYPENPSGGTLTCSDTYRVRITK